MSDDLPSKPCDKHSGNADPGIEFLEKAEDIYEVRKLVFYGAWEGTSIAGGIFGVLLFFWELGLSIDIHISASYDFLEALLHGALFLVVGFSAGFFIGAIWAGVVAPLVGLSAVAILKSLGILRTPVWYAFCIGAWTGLFCCGEFVWCPIILGQVGAVISAKRFLKRQSKNQSNTFNATASSQFSLRQLFRFTTILCICFGLLSILKISNQFRFHMGYCLLWQCFSIPFFFGIRKIIRSRST